MSRVGETIAGKYRIIAPIGVGGMGTVYAARHLQLDTPLALKFLTDNSSGSIERFLREAKACAGLKSEHVCRVSDYGIDGDTPYIAMELLEGEDLAAVLRAGKVDIATAVDYVIQACVGIAEAHSVGIVHRDLKPGNLFLTKRPDGSPLVKVVDFGVAKVPVGSSVSLTQTASVIGSPAYMSPEQVRSSRSVDARADIWALGVILYELVSDRHPFKGASLTDLAVAIAMDPHAPLVEAPELEQVVSRALEKDPNRRYVDVASFAGALQGFTTKHDDSADVASRILYGSVERPTVPRHVARHSSEVTFDDGPPTELDALAVGDDTRSTTMQRSTGELTGRRKTARRWSVSLAVAAVLVGGGATAFIATHDDTAEPAIAPVVEVVAKPPPPAPPPPPEVTKGRVIVTVSGTEDGVISIDGTERGHGARIVDDLSIGPHQIELRVGTRDPIRQPVEIEAGMISTVAIVVPAAPTAPPIVAVVAKAAPKPRRPPPGKPKPIELGEPPVEPVTEEAPPEPPALAMPPCPIMDRLPSGGCPPVRAGERILQADFMAGIRQVWPVILHCKGTEPQRVVIAIKVRPDGTAIVSVVSASDKEVGGCVANAVAGAKFPPTRLGGSVRYPIDL